MNGPLARTASLAALAAGLALVACGGGGARSGDGAAPRLAAGDSAAAAECPPDSAEDVRNADVAIVATVRARSLEHREPPRTRVGFPGEGARDTLSCDTRTNLERPVRARRTYRDVEVRYRATVRLDTALARMMADSVTAARDTARRP
ncbi:MAG TPA: hypothetical protein VFR81_01030 [Longimicrobium sp.]|nr:hypothetical protein [Longimicrobium sp.]